VDAARGVDIEWHPILHDKNDLMAVGELDEDAWAKLWKEWNTW
jgi:hypothetical protein